MHSTKAVKTLVQCDFDGTITQEDMGYMLLDTFASREWRQLLDAYKEHQISVDYFNTKAFAMVKADRQTLLKFVKNKVKIRAGVDNIELFAAQTQFGTKGIEAQYIGPDGNQLQDGFKEAYIRLFLSKGYRLVYIGNGSSDIPSARLAHHVFATDELLTYCQETNLNCTPFVDLKDIVRGLDFL